MTKKKVIAIVVTTLALTAGSIGVAGAASKASHKATNKVSVTKEETRQSRPTDCWPDPMGADRPMGGKGGPLDADRAAMEALVSATIGVDSATVKSRLQAGESLAQIAGAKKDALIAALVADETKRIDAAVTAGKLTAAQATTLKSTLTAHITDEVNSTRPVGPMGGGKGGRGHGDRGGMGGAMGSPKLTLPATPKA